MFLFTFLVYITYFFSWDLLDFFLLNLICKTHEANVNFKSTEFTVFN